jgi:hypothetical protein
MGWRLPAASPACPRGGGTRCERRASPFAPGYSAALLAAGTGQRHEQQYSLQTSNIAPAAFLSPFQIESGTPNEVEVQLIIRSLGRATVRMSAGAHVIRSEPAEKPGWYGIAAAFDEISYRRDENLTERFSPR